MHTYKCQTIRVVDGNTVDAIIDLGFNVTISQRIKLYGVYVEDIKSTDSKIKNMAIKSKEKLSEILGKEFVCETIMNKRGRAGRIMGKINTTDASGNKIDVNDMLIQQGFAKHFGE